MTDMNRINDAALENVVGGVNVTVHNDAVNYANIRVAPGLDSKIIGRVDNGTKLITTGRKVTKDGYVWYEVQLATGSDDGWIAGSLIGF